MSYLQEKLSGSWKMNVGLSSQKPAQYITNPIGAFTFLCNLLFNIYLLVSLYMCAHMYRAEKPPSQLQGVILLTSQPFLPQAEAWSSESSQGKVGRGCHPWSSS